MKATLNFLVIFIFCFFCVGWIGNWLIERFGLGENEFIGLFLFVILFVTSIIYWVKKVITGIKKTASKMNNVVQSVKKSAVCNETEEY